MANKVKKKDNKKWTFWLVIKVIVVSITKLIWNIVRIPYWTIKGIILSYPNKSNNKSDNNPENNNDKDNKSKTDSSVLKYHPLKILKTNKGDFDSWEKKTMNSESAIGIILGARGSGKTAFGLRWAENLHAKKGKKVFALGFNKNEMPSWVDVIEKISEVEENSFLLIDEGGILFNSRNTMGKPNKLLSELLLISRHKNLSVLFISQNSSNLEINALRQADYLILKPSSLLQQEFERKIIQKLYLSTEKDFNVFKDEKGAVYIYSSDFQGFASNDLPSFWSTKISKSFREEVIV